MGNHRMEVNGIELDSADYALLNAVALDRWQAYLLAAENMDDIINRHPHGLTGHELSDRFLRLWQGGLIECSHHENPLNEDLLHPNAELVRQQFDRAGVWPPSDERIIFCGLTMPGGVIWERFTVLNWDKFVSNKSLDGKTFILTGADRNLVERTFELHHISGSIILALSGTEKWDVVRPWQATYWKTLPIGYQVQFRTVLDSGPYSEIERYHKEVAKVGALKHWCKTFQQVCDEYFKNG